MIPQPIRKNIGIIVLIVSIFFVGRTLLHLAMEYTVKNYFKNQVTLSAKTSVSYKLKKLEIFWTQNMIRLNDLSIAITQSETIDDTTKIALTIPELTLDLLSIKEVIFDRSLTIERMILNNPTIHFFSPIKEDTLVAQKEVGRLHQKTLKFLQDLEIKNFSTQNATLLWSTGPSETPTYSLENITVNLDTIEIIPENLSGEKITELLLTDHLEVILGQNSIQLPSSKNLLTFKSLKISSKEKEILLDSLHLEYTDQKDSGDKNTLQNDLSIPSLHLKGIDFLTLYLNNYLLVDTIFVGGSQLHFEVDKNTLSLFHPDQKSPSHSLDSLQINHVQLIPTYISINQNNQFARNSIKADSTSVTLTKVNYSKKTDSTDSWSLENLQLYLKKYQSKLRDAHYSLNFETLNWSFKNRDFALEGIQIYPIKDSLSQTENQLIQYLEIPAILIKNIDFEDLIVHERLDGGKITIVSPDIGILLPKSPAKDPKGIPEISTALNQFLADFNLESVDFQQGNLALYRGGSSPFLTLNNLNISGKDWKVADTISHQINVDLIARVGNGTLSLPEYKVEFTGVNLSSKEDFLSIQDIILRPSSLSKNIKGEVRLNEVFLDGFLYNTPHNKINSMKIGKAKVNLVFNEPSTNKAPLKENKFNPFFIDHFSIGDLEATIQKPETGTLNAKGLEAYLKSIRIGGADFPFTIDMDNSFAKMTQSSLAFNYGKVEFDSLDLHNSTLTMYGTTATGTGQSEEEFTISTPLISVSKIQLPDSLNEFIGVERFSIQGLDGNFRFNKRVDSGSGKSDAKNISSQAFGLLLDTLQIKNANFTLEQETNEGGNFWKSEVTNIDLFDVRYPYSPSNYYVGDFDISLNKFVHKQKDVGIRVDQANLSSRNKLITLINSELDKSDSSELMNGTSINLDIPRMTIRTEEGFNLNQHQDVAISEFLVDNPTLSIKGDLETDKMSTSKEKHGGNNSPISSLDLRKFAIKNMSIDLQIPQDCVKIWFEGLDLAYDDFYWNSKVPLGIEELVASGDWSIGLNQGKASFSYPAKTAEISGVSISGSSSKISWTSVDFKTSDSPISYSSFLTHQETWLGVETGAGSVSGIHWREVLKSGVNAQKVRIDQLKLMAYRDQRLPFPDNHFPPMLHKTLVNSAMPVSIDTVKINDGNVHVETQPPTGEKTAGIEFSNVDAILTNITNLPEEIEVNNKLNMKATAMIQGSGKLNNEMDFSLDDPNYSFFMDVSLGKMDLKVLNSLVEPLASVRIKKGKMRKMEIKALGNEDYAYGNLDFLYRKLSISILDKKEHDHQNLGHAIESFLANELIIRRNNDHPFPHRQGQLFFVRDPTKSIFNYFGKIALSGILTSVGVKSNRKALKKKHEEELKLIESKLANKKNALPD